MQILIRRLSQQRIKNFEERTGKTINMSGIKHMFVNENTIDLSRAKNSTQLILAERITVDPKKQGRGENRQLIKLNNLFGNIERHKACEMFLRKGKIYDFKSVPDGVRTDLDAMLVEKNCIVAFSLKDTEGNDHNGGGSQNAAFDQMIDLIAEAPNKGKVWLGLYLSGEFWTVQRQKYKTYKKAIYPTSLIEILRTKAQKKNVIIFSDEHLPKKKTTFYNWFIK